MKKPSKPLFPQPAAGPAGIRTIPPADAASAPTVDNERAIYDAIMENTRTQLAFLDRGFNFVKVNSAYVDGSGHSRAELIGRNHFELFPNAENLAIFERVRDTGQPAQYYAKPFCYEHQPWRGTTYWDWSLVPVRDGRGVVQGFVLSLMEVTEQVKAKQRLEEALNKLQQLNEQLMAARRRAEERAAELDAVFEAMNDAVTIFDVDERMSRTNPVAAALFGLDAEPNAIEGLRSTLRWLDGSPLNPGEFPPYQALQGARVRERYFHYLHQDGRELTLQVAAAPLRLRNHIGGAVVTWHDITERETLFNQLEHERARLASVLEQMPSGVLIAEAPSGRLTLANNQVAAIFRQPVDSAASLAENGAFQWLRRDGSALLPQEWPLTRAIMEGETVPMAELTLRRGDGTRGVVEISAAPIRDRDGAIIAGVAVLSDVTERKEAAEKLRLANQLQQIIESIPDGVFVLDGERRVIAWNRAMERLTGISREAVSGRADYYQGIALFENRPVLVDSIWDGYRQPEAFRSFSREGDTFIARLALAPAGGGAKGIYLEARATPLKNDQEQIIGAIQTIRDITRQQEMEEESLKAQKIESLGLLAGGIAHDFNNFLTAILANLQLARLKLTKGLDVAKALQNMEETIFQASALTRQLLTFSKGGAPVKRNTAVNDLLHDTVEFALRGSNVKCRFRITPDLWTVNVDSGQISQVLSNLTINALQAMPDGGQLSVEADNIGVGMDEYLPVKPGNYLRIVVTDQGMGIASENLPRIFDPYFTTKPEGNGLGLATSYFIISNHGGHISVASTVGVGTSFTIYLPAVRGERVEGVREEAVLTRGRGRILLMEDELVLSQAAGEMLQEIGYEVEYAENGQMALEKYGRKLREGAPFDLVLLDLTIPGGMGGKETMAGLLKIDPRARAVVTSGYPDDPVLLHYSDYGFCDKIIKPYTIEELSEVLQRVLRATPTRLTTAS
jgi:PAS domain S-box-containing protein